MKIIASYAIKGGVGKTTTAVNLAYLAAQSGARTLLWDLDAQGAATYCLRVSRKLSGDNAMRGRCELQRLTQETMFDRLRVLPNNGSHHSSDLAFAKSRKPTHQLHRLMEPLAQHYDVLILDCSPGLSLTSENVFQACGALVVPTVPTTLSLRGLGQLVGHLRTRGPRKLKLLPFFSAVDGRKALHRTACDDASRLLPFLNTRIPYSSIVEQMGVNRAPLAEYAPTYPATAAFKALWLEVRDRIEAMDQPISPIPETPGASVGEPWSQFGPSRFAHLGARRVSGTTERAVVAG